MEQQQQQKKAMIEFQESSGIYTRSSSSSEQVVQIPLHPHLDFVTYMFMRRLGGTDDEQQRQQHHGVALIDAESGQSLGRSQIRDRIESLSRGMQRRLGIKQGDVVMLLLPNTLHFPIIFNAILKLGAVAAPMNPLNTPQEIARQMHCARPVKLLFTNSGGMAKLDKQLQLNGQLPVVLVPSASDARLDDPAAAAADNVYELHDLMLEPQQHVRVCIRQSDPAALLFSSGTTGVSKAVVLSHGNLIATMSIAGSVPGEMLPASSVILVLFPMYHVGGLIWLACGAILNGGPQLLLLPRYKLSNVLLAIQRYRVTKITSAPPVALDLLKSNSTGEYDLSSLKVLLCAAAPLGKDTMEAVMVKFPHLSGFVQTTTLGSGEIGPWGSAGVLKPCLEAKVVDLETHKPLPPGQSGELLLRGPSVMQGYLNDPLATCQAIDDQGWLHTGDLVHFDHDGYLYIVDRLKELIKYKGYQVAPAELEAILLTLPGVNDCAVVPFPDEAAGEIPMACIVKHPHKPLTGEQVMDFVATQVSFYKKIRRVVFLDAIPKSAAGKILRMELKLQFTSRL